MKGKKFVVVGSNGSPCPRCGEPTEIREHREITEKQLRQPFYYTRWFNCINPKCKTTIFMLEEYKVINKNAAARTLQMLEEDQANIHRIGSLF